MIERAFILVTILIGLFGLLFKRNLLLRVLSMDVMGTGIVSLFVFTAAYYGKRTPTVSEEPVDTYADPVLQGVILTAIVIGFSIMALVLVAAMLIAKRFPRLHVDEIEAHWRDEG